MPFQYKKKTDRKEIPLGVIHRAVKEVQCGAKILPTATKYEIPRSSLQRYLKLEQPFKNSDNKFVSRQIFTTHEETSLVEYLIKSSQLHYGLTNFNCRKLAYEYAVSMNKDVPEN